MNPTKDTAEATAVTDTTNSQPSTSTSSASAAAAAQKSALETSATPETGITEDSIAGEEGVVSYAHVGEEFTDWFNDKLRQLPNQTIQLGTKTATAVMLHEDGRLECSLHAAAGEGQQQFVAFSAQYLDQLVRRIAAIGL